MLDLLGNPTTGSATAELLVEVTNRIGDLSPALLRAVGGHKLPRRPLREVPR